MSHGIVITTLNAEFAEFRRGSPRESNHEVMMFTKTHEGDSTAGLRSRPVRMAESDQEMNRQRSREFIS
jgi:hypothetical protein